MMELILIIALIMMAHRLRRAARVLQRPVEIHIYYHSFPGPGEAAPRSERAGTNVIELRPKKIAA
jgi:hypothetical protein